MPPLPDRQALEAMKRSDLQKLCKDYGVKANLKTENIISLLLDTYDSKATPLHSEQPTRRSVSTRMSSRSSGHGRTSSVIIHDIEEDNNDNPENYSEQEEDRISEPVPEPVQPPFRTRKAKDTQTRLGVGRPVAAGGKGARAVTKSVSLSRSKRAKSRTVRPIEDTIPEEPEQIPEMVDDTQPKAEPSNNAELETQPEIINTSQPSSSSDDIDKRITDALQPLYQQLKVLKSEFDQMRSLKNEMTQLQTQIADVQTWKQKVDSLTAEVKDLRQKAANVDLLTAELRQLKETVASLPRSSTPSDENMAGYRTPTMTKAPVPSTLIVPQPQAGPSTLSVPSIAPILLGKRHRDSTSSDMTGVVEESKEDELTESELARRVLRPDKKRPKLSNEPSQGDQAGSSSSLLQSAEVEQADDAPRVPSFTVFSGPEPEDDSYVDPPPPTTPLPDFYGPGGIPGPSRHSATTSTQHAAENQHPFGFSFVPVPSTPGADLYSFPYPEPPQSPTPTGTGNTSIIRGNRERTDVFHSFGLPNPDRPRLRVPSSGTRPRENPIILGDTIDPVALTGEGSSTAGAPSEDGNGNSGSAVKRTMYGTELEGDTRFGDFGVEGVAKGFWTGGRF